MVAINFTVFQDKILGGSKRQTIRRGARCKPGDRLQLYTGMRTKACRKLGEAVCAEVVPVILPAGTPARLLLGGKLWVRGKALADFAAADGFTSIEAFRAFFRLKYALPFEGVVITWRDFQRAGEV